MIRAGAIKKARGALFPEEVNRKFLSEIEVLYMYLHDAHILHGSFFWLLRSSASG